MIVKGLAAVSGPFIAASLHPVREEDITSDKLGPGVNGWAGYGFTGNVSPSILGLL